MADTHQEQSLTPVKSNGLLPPCSFVNEIMDMFRFIMTDGHQINFQVTSLNAAPRIFTFGQKTFHNIFIF